MTLMTFAAAALIWIQAHAPHLVPRDPEPVKIVLKSPEELWNMGAFPIPYSERGTEEIWGLHINGVVYITTDCDYQSNKFCQSVIVHELVHYLQEMSETEYRCVGLQEKEAYLLQRDWLTERGYNLWSHIDPLYTFAMFRCGDEFGGDR